MSAPASAKASRNGRPARSSDGRRTAWRCAAEAPSPPPADRQVGHEMPVHDVDMDPVGARLVDRAHFLAELGEVGGQDRGGDEGAAWSRLSGFNRARTRRAMKKPSSPPCASSRPGRMRTRPLASAARNRAGRRAVSSGNRALRRGRRRSPPRPPPARANRPSKRAFRRASAIARRDRAAGLQLGAVGDDLRAGRDRGLRDGGGTCRSPSRARRAGSHRICAPASSAARRRRPGRPRDASGRDSRAVVRDDFSSIDAR